MVMPRDTELNNIKAGVTTLLAASDTGQIMQGAGTLVTNLKDITTLVKGQVVSLSDYVSGLVDGAVGAGRGYIFSPDGTVQQKIS